MDERPSGWYDDPDEPSRLRYWDGSAWTERTHAKAPMPGPQVGRAPVTRLRHPREREATQGSDGSRGAAVPPATPPSGSRGAVADAPRPWSRDAGKAGAARTAGTAAADAVTPPRARFFRRFLAFLLDFALVFLVFVVLLAAAMPFLGDTYSLLQAYTESVQRAWQNGTPAPTAPENLVTLNATVYMVFAALLALYDYVLTQTVGSTLGGLATGVRVVHDGEGELRSWQLLVRAVLKYAFFVCSAVPGGAAIGLAFTVVDVLWPVTDRRRRTLHERWSRTRAVLRRAPSPGER